MLPAPFRVVGGENEPAPTNSNESETKRHSAERLLRIGIIVAVVIPKKMRVFLVVSLDNNGTVPTDSDPNRVASIAMAASTLKGPALLNKVHREAFDSSIK